MRPQAQEGSVGISLDDSLRADWSGALAAVMNARQEPVARYCREGDDLIVVYADGEQMRIKGYFLENEDGLSAYRDLHGELTEIEKAAQSGEMAIAKGGELGRLEEMFGGREESIDGVWSAADSELDSGDSTSIPPFAVIGPLALLAVVAGDGGGDSGGSNTALRGLLANFESATEADFQAAGVTGVTAASLPTARAVLGAMERGEREAMTLGQAQELANIAGLVHTEYNKASVSFIAPSEVGTVSASFDDPDAADGERTLTLDIPLLSERYSDRIVEIDMDGEFRRVEVRIDHDSDGNWNNIDEYSYDSAGMVTRLVEKLDRRDAGAVDWIWESQYDSQGRLHIRTQDTDADGNLERSDEYFYNDQDQVIRIKYDLRVDGILERSERFQYDEEGRRSRMETDFLNNGTVDSVHVFGYDEDGRHVYTLADTGVDGDKSGDTDQDGTMDYLDFVEWETYVFAPTVEEAEAIGVIDKAINMAGRTGSTTLVLTDEVLAVFTGDDSSNSIEVEGGIRHSVRLSGGIVETGETDGNGYVEYQGTAGSLFIDPRIIVDVA